MNKPDELTELNTFEAWEPDKFAKDARYMRTIKSFTSGQIHGDVLDVGCGSRIFCELSRASTWTGLDISNRMLDSIHFSEEFTNKKIMQGDVLDLPFDFWKPKAFLAFAEAAGFKPQAPYVHVPIVESIYQPATKITTPAFLNSNLIQKMTIVDFQI